MMDRGYDNTLTISSAENDILRLSAPDSGHLGTPDMDAFDHDLNFEGENLLYYSPALYCHYLVVCEMWSEC